MYYKTHRPRIEGVIRELIELGRFEEDETVVIRTHDLERKPRFLPLADALTNCQSCAVKAR